MVKPILPRHQDPRDIQKFALGVRGVVEPPGMVRARIPQLGGKVDPQEVQVGTVAHEGHRHADKHPQGIPRGGRCRPRQRHPLTQLPTLFLHLFEVMRHGAVPLRQRDGQSGMPSLSTSAGGGNDNDGGRLHVVVGSGRRHHLSPIDAVVQNSLGGQQDGQGKTWTTAGRDGNEDEDNDGGTHRVS